MIRRFLIVLCLLSASVSWAQTCGPVSHKGLRFPSCGAVQAVKRTNPPWYASAEFDIILLSENYQYNSGAEARLTNLGSSAGAYAYQTVETLKPSATSGVLDYTGSIDAGTQKGLLLEDVNIPSSGFTVFSYARVVSVTYYEYVFGRVSTDRSTGWAMGGMGSETNFGLAWYNGWNSGLGPGGPVHPSHTYWHVTAIRCTPGTEIKAYIDGVPFASTTSSIPASFDVPDEGRGKTVGIGAELRWTGSAWELKYGHSGYIDSVWVKYGTLTDAEVQALSSAILSKRARSAP